MGRRHFEGIRTVITGASSGIGRELARQLAAQGARLLLTARRADRLEQLRDEIAASGSQVDFLTGDITDASIRRRLVAAASSRWNGLDLLINNAGVGAVGPFTDASEDRLRRVMEVNFFAPVELSRLAIPLLAEGSRPRIVNVVSVLGHRAVPNKSEYCASKFAMHGFSDALRAELRVRGIGVLMVSPSTTESEFFERALEGAGASPRRGMPAEVVARKTLRAIRRGADEVILSSGGRLLVWVDRLFPAVANFLVARFG